MKLSAMLEEQNTTQLLMGRPMGTGESAAKENVLALIVEATEVLNELNWKPWRVQNTKVDKEKLIAELVDAQKFLCNIMNEMYVTEADFEEAWHRKSKEVKWRLQSGY